MKKIVLLLLLVAILGGIAFYLSSSNDPFKSEGVEQSDFAIADTASIGKILIADRSGRVVKLNREGEQWLLNGKYPAREDAITTLLRTFKNIYIQRPVPREALEQVNTVMATSTKKVEIYDLDGDLIKTWYVGHATMDKKGTYMLLETPKNGKSSVPFIMDMKGFIGMLNTRFFLDENEWRSTMLLAYPEMNLNEIEVEYPTDEASSFKVKYGGGNEIELFTADDNPIAVFDTSTLKDYMLNYKKMAFENYRTGLSEVQIDSVRSTIPFQIIRVTDNSGRHEIKLWPKKAPDYATGQKADSTGLDRERIYAVYNDGELALAQRFVWDKFRAPLGAFVSKE
ncbi:DUF4340 domain-containing protein [Cryomorphaceae bacterium 1068]|nr:DUF4340 domain-containing protein [Cryomorphaceae bacterium 1068]